MLGQTLLRRLLLRPSTSTSTFAVTRSFSKRRAVNVVLLEDLALRGFEGEEVAVKPGFARNFLIPKKKAVYATEVNKGKHVIEHSEEERALMEEKRDWLAFKERAAVRPIVFTGKVELDNQTLETPLTKADLAAAVRKQLKRRVEEAEIRLQRGSTIKTVGDVVIRLELVLPQLLQGGEGAAGAGAAGGTEKKEEQQRKKEVVEVKVTVQKDETKRDRKLAIAPVEDEGAEGKK